VRTRPKNAWTAATTDILLPALKAHHFHRFKPRTVGRIRDGILQYFDLQMSTSGRGRVLRHKTSWSWNLDAGCRTSRDAKSSGERAPTNLQMIRCARFYRSSRSRAFFEATDTTMNLYDYRSTERWASQHHLEFLRGSCLPRIGRCSEANEQLRAPIRHYAEDGRPWCATYSAHCERLGGSLRDGTPEELLEEWLASTRTRLKL
jgi:hypothetical protein